MLLKIFKYGKTIETKKESIDDIYQILNYQYTENIDYLLFFMVIFSSCGKIEEISQAYLSI